MCTSICTCTCAGLKMYSLNLFLTYYEKDMFFCLFICMVTLYTIMINNDYVWQKILNYIIDD